ncbi:MAG TPA: hypothetical protein DEP66_06385 [Acidimicrobiaceae bacterium]|nr:hypothetical protein [Acidimicrobiaceae bacterium]HCB37814.1 hypothetical protein [Acidimicrobiaceae bacterium]
MAAVQSIERAFAVMRALAVGPLGVSDIADRAGLPKSTVARLLAALETEDAVVQDGFGGDYRLGDGLTDLAASVGSEAGLAAMARPHLLELVDLVGETAGLAVRSGNDVYYLDHVEFDTGVQVRSWTGEYVRMHLVPSGLVLLAELPAAELREYLAQDLEAPTPASMTDPEQLGERLGRIRSAGYAWVFEELVEGISSVAAPVRTAGTAGTAALHVHGPAYRFPDPNRMHDIGLQVAQCADRLAVQLDAT